MDRITREDLEYLAELINVETSSPKTAYTKDEGGKLRANIGNYHLDGAYGGHRLVRMVNESGGITTITTGFIPKRELYERMDAFLAGLKAGKEA